MDLSLVSRDDLLDEVASRFDAFVWSGVKSLNQTEEAPQGGWYGGKMSAIGLAESIKQVLMADISEKLMREDNEK